MVFIKDIKDNNRRRTVVTSTTGESRLVTHTDFALLSHGALALPTQGNPSSLLECNYFRLELEIPEAQTQARGSDDRLLRI